MRCPWIYIPQLLNDTGAAWEIGFITPATDRTITPWLILFPIPSFLFSLMPSISLCSLCFYLLLHFLNVILFQNTSDKHRFWKKVMFAFTDSYSCLSLPFSVFFSVFSLATYSMIYSEWERTFYFATFDRRLCWAGVEDEVLWKELYYSPLHRAFLS